MSDSVPPAGPDPVERILAAFTSVGRAMTEFAENLRPVAESLRPVVEAVAKIARDPRVQAAIAGDLGLDRRDCHCLCAEVHGDDPGSCEGTSVSAVRISGMDVPMRAPCQAARAASKLSGPA